MLRFAPSPYGEMHIEDLRIAIFNFIVAKQRGVPFCVRIDDCDKSATIEGKDTEIMQILEKFALSHDRVHHQSEHLRMHQNIALRLLRERKAFICTCEGDCKGACAENAFGDYAALKESGKPFVVRMRKPEARICVKDTIRGEYTFEPDNAGYAIILDSEGNPSCDFATACEEMLGSVTFVIRKEKYLPQTPVQIDMMRASGYDGEIVYAHLPPLFKEEDEEKLSLKRLFKEGFVPDAIINYILLESGQAPMEICTLPDAIEGFSLESVPTSPVPFDEEKLKKLNREHLSRIEERELSLLFGFADADIGKLAKLYLGELSTVGELSEKISAIFSPKRFEGKYASDMRTLQAVLSEAPMLKDYDALEAYIVRRTGMTPDRFAIPLKLLLTGTESGPDIKEIYPYLKCYLLEVIS